MEFGKTSGMLFTICEWITRLAYVNLLWLLFSAAGMFVWGIMPSTVALFTVVRKWLLKETGIPVWNTFWKTYRKEFLRANLLGLLLLIPAVLVAIDLMFLKTVAGPLQIALFIPLWTLILCYLLTLLFLFPVYVHYRAGMIDSIKYAWFHAVLNPHRSVIMLVAVAAVIFLNLYMTALIPFFSGVMIAAVLMTGGYHSFNRIKRKTVTQN
ncbi:YesL family protein [Kroppenstedtia eburnea]|uniref:YesL family protein n=1 Tax=Kroppenstedtia eburnea TaxID=714067 RepID=UPI003638F8B8